MLETQVLAMKKRINQLEREKKDDEDQLQLL